LRGKRSKESLVNAVIEIGLQPIKLGSWTESLNFKVFYDEEEDILYLAKEGEESEVVEKKLQFA
jgi:hypothetical protein